MSAYDVLTLDVSTVQSGGTTVLADDSKRVTSLYVLQLPTGVQCSVVLGTSGRQIPLKFPGQTIKFRYPENRGVFFINTLQQVGKVKIAMFYAGNTDTGEAFMEGAAQDELTAFANLGTVAIEPSGAAVVILFKFINPLGSGVIDMISEIIVSLTVADLVVVKLNPQAGTPVSSGGTVWRDQRQPGTPKATWATATAASVDVAPYLENGLIPANGPPFVWPVNITLDQNQAIAIETGTASAKSMAVVVHFKEIPR